MTESSGGWKQIIGGVGVSIAKGRTSQKQRGRGDGAELF